MKTFKVTIPILVVAFVCMIGISSPIAETCETLSTGQRKIIPIAAFTANGNMPKLEAALVEGLDAGLTVNEIKEILVHSYAYAGFPRALNGISMFITVMDRRKEQGIKDEIGKEATAMSSDFDKNTYGHKVRNALVGRDISKRTGGYPVFVPIIDQFLVDHLFADIFYRDVLNHQERELVTISILAAMPGTEPQLNSHLRVSMNVGLTKTQIEDYLAVLREEVSEESAERATKSFNDLLGIGPVENIEKAVKVIKKGKSTKGSADYFTGNVTVESRFSSEKENSYRGGIVNFDAGTRTAWHTHPLGQTLIVTSGRGVVQSEGEAVQQILPGDVVWIPANVRHWHGATPDSPMSHVAISDSMNDSTVEWMEKVSDE
ncbi:(R)-mandelonitrile lyase [Desulfobacter vibrioformis]|uniref:(R)-mandelonitrile lyase n=1 Tax=Desulfobacter vibrioformis TaxID=34031 RepID=UPI0005567D77|nr:carboxymuconolactone decarboxylase family protein [Desulfobacter vibrioformis]